MHLVKLVAAAVVAFLVGAVIATGVSSPASAEPLPGVDIPGPVGNAYNLMNYPLSVRGAELFAANTDAAKAAWTRQLGQQAASGAGAYSANAVYGNLTYGPETPGWKSGVVPVDVAQEAVPPRRPAFAPKKMTLGPLGSPTGAAIAATAWWMRADIANGTLGWFGIDAHGAVCADPVWGSGFVGALLTGQDCSQWGKPTGYVPNDGLVPHPPGFVSVTMYVTTGGKEEECIFGSPTAITGGLRFSCVLTKYTYGFADTLAMMFQCKSVAGAIKEQTTASVSTPPLGGLWSWDVKCPAGQDLYALGSAMGPSAFSGDSIRLEPSFNWPAGGWLGIHNDAPNTRNPNMGYFGATNPNYSPGFGGDPDYTIQCTLTMTDSGTVSGTTAAFKDTGDAWPAPVCGTVPSGRVVAHKTVTLVGGGEVRTLQDDDTTDAYRTAAAADPSLCTGVGKACILDLIDVATGVTCFNEGDTCDGWMQDADRDTKYSCYYGGQATVVNDCYVYATTFNAEKRLAGNGYADPHTGEDVGAAGPTSKSADEELMGRGVGVPGAPSFSWSSCFGGTYSAFNPIEWVLKPIQCSLKWAFVPDAAVVQATGASVQDAFANRAPGQITAMVAGWHVAPVMTGCKIETSVPQPFGPPVNVPVVDACPGTPLAPIALLCRLLVSASVAVGAVIASRRAVAGMVDYRGV